MSAENLFEQILIARGLKTRSQRDAFLNPSYDAKHDPFLLPDMKPAVERLVKAHKKQERIAIYGDYDIDGLTATTLLLDALGQFEFRHVSAFIPNRFVEGYGLTVDAIERIAADGAELIITVDCGSLSHEPIARAKELGVDVIVTDHHNVAEVQPPAEAVINPKRPNHKYPFIDLAGVGVAFKLVQALQTKLDGVPVGQEKWLLDLVALGTVCDVVTLVDENRANVFWGLKVLAKTRRPGLKALMAVSRIEPDKLTTRSLGFMLGPRMNAAGRLETAQIALDMLTTDDPMVALEKAERLDALNLARRSEQDQIYKEAIQQAEQFTEDNVLVVSAPNWNHGIVGIVAAKLLEKYKKPTFVLQEIGEESKGSARSYGDFSAADAIRASDGLITKGGGHKLAAGVTLPTKNIAAFRQRVNEFYKAQKLVNQTTLLLPKSEVVAELQHVSEVLIEFIAQLEPFGNGNEQPILRSSDLRVIHTRRMGSDSQHLKLETQDSAGRKMQFLAFNAPAHFFVEPGELINVWYQPDINEWQGRRSVEGRLLHLEMA
ncbi:single-stranded-DNA-specific exonuclease RecJ [Candidatus Saccharibacteria bacterium RAAC3_TM7_1]|nr:single-stranded-DNA-specific exonuclease RecJ [Candidatus Saccharibacteria bacterium RAAC3_TM7_1]HCZ28648.1 single-stranded-DNA-specific exonuclease RecJ [Candidatus Saccharibacteria bacterium]